MIKYAVDSWAWIEYLDGSEIGLKIKPLLENQIDQKFTSVMTVSEIISWCVRKSKDIDVAIATLQGLSTIVPVGQEDAIMAGRLHGEIRKKIRDFGLGDAHVLALARKENAKILTGDLHFKDFKETILIT